MNIDIYRYHKDNIVTLSTLRFRGHNYNPLYVLENPWLDNKVSVSCIPKGTYECKPYSSAKYPNVYIVTKVKGRSHILFHAGNYVQDTRGCLLLGTGVNYNKIPMVTSSRHAINLFRQRVGDKHFVLNIYEI